MKRRIVLDTDIGSDVDDAIALGLALASPELDLVAVTTVSREPMIRARIARRLLDLAGRPEIPVFAGGALPLGGGDAFVWFGNEGEGILEPGDTGDVPTEPALDALARMFAADSGLELVAIGPLTNLAELFQRYPRAVKNVAQLTIMGGHIRDVGYGGCSFPHGVDYNLCADPEASLVVLRSGVPTRLVTADVTLQTWITPADLERIEAAGTPFHAALGAAIRAWTPVMRDIFGGWGAVMGEDNVAFLHDPLALACVYDESFCRFEDLDIEPTMESGVLRTIEHPRPDTRTWRMRCATVVDARRIRSHVVERLESIGG
jgi:inosine-uridine nucleoside N-ribohydrolase